MFQMSSVRDHHRQVLIKRHQALDQHQWRQNELNIYKLTELKQLYIYFNTFTQITILNRNLKIKQRTKTLSFRHTVVHPLPGHNYEEFLIKSFVFSNEKFRLPNLYHVPFLLPPCSSEI